MIEAPILAKIRQLIAEDQIPLALQELKQSLAHSLALDEVLLQAARQSELAKQIRQGTISQTQAALQKNEIRAALLDLLRVIESPENYPQIQRELNQAQTKASHQVQIHAPITAGGNVQIGVQNIQTESRVSRNLRLTVFLLFPLIVIISVYLWQRNQRLQLPLQLKVYVEKRTKNSFLDSLQVNEKLTLIYGSKKESKKIMDGEVTFDEIPSSFRGEKVQLTYDAKGFIPIDTNISLNISSVRLFPRRNDDYALLEGFIYTEEGEQLSGVQVSIAYCCRDTTDTEGRFNLIIPPEHQRLNQRLDLFKEGFESKSETVVISPSTAFRWYLSKK